MNYSSYISLAKKVVKALLDRGEIWVASQLSIGTEAGLAVVRGVRGEVMETGPLDALTYFVTHNPQEELFVIVSRKCEWI